MITGEQQKQIIEALKSGPKGPETLIAFEAEKLMADNPALSKAQALEKIMKSEYGVFCYELHRALTSRHKPTSSGLGPVAQEVLKRKEQTIEKSAGRISEAAAYEKIFKADPALYDRYVEEVTVSTAVR